jgi:hypothetical protein
VLCTLRGRQDTCVQLHSAQQAPKSHCVLPGVTAGSSFLHGGVWGMCWPGVMC